MTKYSLDVTTQFKKDFKRCIKRGLPIAKIQEAMRLLETDGFLPAQFRPHKLSGNLVGKWECHNSPYTPYLKMGSRPSSFGE